MCDLISASIALTVLGGAFSYVGQQQQMSAQQDAANAQAAQDRNNAILAQRAADDATARGNAAADQQRTAGKALAARQVAAMAANGVDVGSGTALDIQADQAGQNQLDVLTVKSNAARETANYAAQGSNYTAAANLNSAKADSIGAAAPIAGIGSLLNTGTQVAGTWMKFGNTGLTPTTPAGWGYGGNAP